METDRMPLGDRGVRGAEAAERGDLGEVVSRGVLGDDELRGEKDPLVLLGSDKTFGISSCNFGHRERWPAEPLLDISETRVSDIRLRMLLRIGASSQLGVTVWRNVGQKYASSSVSCSSSAEDTTSDEAKLLPSVRSGQTGSALSSRGSGSCAAVSEVVTPVMIGGPTLAIRFCRSLARTSRAASVAASASFQTSSALVVAPSATVRERSTSAWAVRGVRVVSGVEEPAL